MQAPDYEKLGIFYLGKVTRSDAPEPREDLLLYDSKDLTTHALCVGMTGSGKTGLCLSLLEEAAIDQIPAIAVDPKGDLGNLLLTFPDLKPADFEPWIDPAEATRHGRTTEQYSGDVAQRWKEGLAEWGQSPERIQHFREAVDIAIYTPGSDAGLSLTVLRSFNAPPPEVLADADAFRGRVSAATSGLLALMGIDADPIRSREHILISNILSQAWQQGRSLTIAQLIGEIQSPKFEKVGILDVESFYPAKDRFDLALSLNNLLASPSFAGWMEGDPLDIKRLLYTATGKPRLSVISIAHLSDSERMFFVTILLNEVLAWVRSQPGTSSLRALFYMDEIFGYFPPTSNPPSKTPMLTLLKQARAYGLGVVLATQNPVDLDYKGLSNTGTWFLGRLQTERDKMRVLDGLEGASSATGHGFDRQEMETLLSGLRSREFLMNNVHEDHPVLFTTRWALSYLRGPLTRLQISELMAERKASSLSAVPSTPAIANPKEVLEEVPETESPDFEPPPAPAGVKVAFLRTEGPASGGNILYRPAIMAHCKLHFVRASYKVDTWQPRTAFVLASKLNSNSPWQGAAILNGEPLDLELTAPQGGKFASLDANLTNAKNYDSWSSKLKSHLYREEVLTILKCETLKEYSEPTEDEADFRARLRQLAREKRDLEVEKIREKHASKVASIQKRISTAEASVDREKSQANRAYFDSAISFGSTILGALFGRKKLSSTNVSKASTSFRSAGRAAQQRSDVQRAQEKVEDLEAELKDLEQELAKDIHELTLQFDTDHLEFEKLEVRPRKSDIEVAPISLVWTPWEVSAEGIAEPLFKLPE